MWRELGGQAGRGGVEGGEQRPAGVGGGGLDGPVVASGGGGFRVSESVLDVLEGAAVGAGDVGEGVPQGVRAERG